MTLDQYQLCPCGNGKKIKFCCKDIASELDSISRAIEGQQYEAALQRIEESIAKHKDRQSLWVLKCTALIQTGQFDKAQEAVDQLLSFAPQNPIGLALSAILRITAVAGVEDEKDDEDQAARQDQALLDATTQLHLALANCGTQIPAQVFDGVGLVGQFLIELGHIMPGREHLLFQYAIAGEQPTRGTQLLMETSRSPDLPVLLKQETSLPLPVDWVHWKDDYVAARELGLRGAWTEAADEVARLIAAHEPHVVLLRAHAALRCRLPQPQRAAAALRELVHHNEVPLDEAVEAEALSQLLDPYPITDKTDLLKVAFPVGNADRLMEKLQSDRRAVALGIDFGALATDDSPPPKAGFTILDRELPRSGKELTIDSVPMVLCEALLFGKQTDREARLELIASRPKFETLRGLITELGGNEIVGDPAEEVIDQTPTANEQLQLHPRFPEDTPAEFRDQFVADRQKQLLLDRWPNMKHPALDEKTPAEVADQPKYERRLLGTLLLLEIGHGRSTSTFDFDLLRKQLQLPVPAPIKPHADEARRLPLVRLPRIDASSLSDEDLSICFVRASQNGVGKAVMQLGPELISRESMADAINAAEVYGRMAQHAGDSDASIDLLQKAQQAAKARGDSPAMLMISELTARIMRGDSVEAQSLLNHIQTQHMNEPGVAQMLLQTLQQFGLVGPDGRPAAPTAAPASADTAPVAAAPAEPSQLWTPDDAGAPSPSGEGDAGKSKLWVPGMD